MTTVRVVDSGEKLEVRCDYGQIKRYHAVWLRYECRCEECYVHSADQPRMNPADIPYDIVIESANIAGDDVKITWQNSDHVGILPISHIILHDYSTERLEKVSQDLKPLLLSGSRLPESCYDEVLSSDLALLRWLQQINDYGVSLMTGVPTEDMAMRKAVERIGPLQDNPHGKVFDVYARPGAYDASYTTIKLYDHQDQAYLEAQPGLQFLHCMKFDPEVTGGENTVLDLFHVVGEFRKSNPREFDALTKIPATFVSKRYHSDRPFDLEVRRPHILLNDKGEVICVTWHPHAVGPLRVDENLVLEYYRAIHTFAKAIRDSPLRKFCKLRPGEAICMNNRRMTHGREEFHLNGGERCLQGMYLATDEFKSKLRYLLNTLNENGTVKRSGAISW